MSFPGGSEWRRWDLHIHTPDSHTAQYGSGGWERFLRELRALPADLSVIGINDYLWVDGYAKVLTAHQGGELPNIDAVFPVIELRLDDFIGTEGKLSRLNAHVIFAPGTDPDLINAQFIPRLTTGFKLTDRYRDLQASWDAVPTRAAIAELGRLIKSSVPPEELGNYESDLVEGFNNWVVGLTHVENALRDSSFAERPLLTLGKTEWEDIPWNNNTIAAKKHLISSVDLLFTAAPSPTKCKDGIEWLRSSAVNHRVLDCSDAHAFSDSMVKDRLGNCFTWVCADPTLAGLKHALLEYRGRVYIGEKPDLLVRRSTDPTHFVKRVRIRAADEATQPEPVFDVDIQLSSGFAAVVGNKGSGKSALLDSIALAGNSRAEAQFTFLSDRRFRNPRNNKAPHYVIELTMADGEVIGPLSLSASIDADAPERIRYLPQSLLETLCNKEPGSPDDSFERELRSIIFSHVPEHQRLGSHSLDDLLRHRGEALEREIEHRRAELAEVNQEIAALEEQARPSRLKALRTQLAAMQRQLASHDLARPSTPIAPEPKGDPSVLEATEQLASVRVQLEALEERTAQAGREYATERQRLDASENVTQEIVILRSTYDAFVERVNPVAELAGLQLDQLVAITIDPTLLDVAREDAANKVEQLDQLLGAEGPLARERRGLEEARASSEAMLDLPRRLFEQALHEIEAWEAARASLLGSPSDEGTIEYLNALLGEADGLDVRLDELRARRKDLSAAIHASLMAKVVLYRELYGPVQSFLDANDLARSQFSLEFEAELEMRDFSERFLSFIDRSAAGSYYGVEPSAKRVQQRVRTTHPQEWESVDAFLAENELDLRFDRRPGSSETSLDCASDALRKGFRLAEVYDYLFGLSYIEAQYELRSGGRPISELSPGQKGTILLMFYLLVDRSGRPIALDQPDENLDSQTIHSLLRPAIREAKASRQVIVVTHSPNLAVVGDADQVIVAACDGREFSYTSGSMENPEIRDLVVRVLEGTWPAFSNRWQKYQTSSRDASHDVPID